MSTTTKINNATRPTAEEITRERDERAAYLAANRQRIAATFAAIERDDAARARQPLVDGLAW